MKHPRVRSIIKWTSTVAAPLLLAVWIASARWSGGVDALPTVAVGVFGGALQIGWFEPWSIWPDRFDGVWSSRSGRPLWGPDGFQWWFEVVRQRSPPGITATAINIPIWFLALLAAATAAWIWWRDRAQRKPGHCSNCGYNLRGGNHAEGKCPECGTAAIP